MTIELEFEIEQSDFRAYVLLWNLKVDWNNTSLGKEDSVWRVVKLVEAKLEECISKFHLRSRKSD